MAKAKFGADHVKAMGRQGLSELRNAVYADSNVANKQPEYGVYGHPTPGQVADAGREDGRSQEQQPATEQPAPDSVLSGRLQEAEVRADQQMEVSKEPEPEIDRD